MAALVQFLKVDSFGFSLSPNKANSPLLSRQSELILFAALKKVGNANVQASSLVVTRLFTKRIDTG
jgi:hypothetical protein